MQSRDEGKMKGRNIGEGGIVKQVVSKEDNEGNMQRREAV